MKRVIIWLAALPALLLLSRVLGLDHPFGNPRATTTVETDSPSTLLLEAYLKAASK